MTGFVIRQLGPADAAAYREIRLEGLERHPEAFGSTYEAEAALSPEEFVRRVTEVPTFAAERDGRLLGLVGLARESGVKRRHRGTLIRMYVRPEARGSGAGNALVTHAHEVLDNAGVASTLLHHALPNPRSTPFWYSHGYRPKWTLWARRPALRSSPGVSS